MKCPECGSGEYEYTEYKGYPTYTCSECGKEWAEPAH